MVRFTAIIKKFAAQGEKTGWSYIEIPAALAGKLLPNSKKGFRVKGKLDEFPFTMVALLPMGGGDFIMPLKVSVRKAIRKQKGASVEVIMEIDTNELKPPPEFMECLKDEPQALSNFYKLSKSHQNYYINWINSAKTDGTKAKRIASTLNALDKGWHYGQMMQAMKKEKS